MRTWRYVPTASSADIVVMIPKYSERPLAEVAIRPPTRNAVAMPTW